MPDPNASRHSHSNPATTRSSRSGRMPRLALRRAGPGHSGSGGGRPSSPGSMRWRRRWPCSGRLSSGGERGRAHAPDRPSTVVPPFPPATVSDPLAPARRDPPTPRRRPMPASPPGTARSAARFRPRATARTERAVVARTTRGANRAVRRAVLRYFDAEPVRGHDRASAADPRATPARSLLQRGHVAGSRGGSAGIALEGVARAVRGADPTRPGTTAGVRLATRRVHGREERGQWAR